MTAYSLSLRDPSFEASDEGIIRSKDISAFCITRSEPVLSGAHRACIRASPISPKPNSRSAPKASDASPLHTILRSDVVVHLSPLEFTQHKALNLEYTHLQASREPGEGLLYITLYQGFSVAPLLFGFRNKHQSSKQGSKLIDGFCTVRSSRMPLKFSNARSIYVLPHRRKLIAAVAGKRRFFETLAAWVLVLMLVVTVALWLARWLDETQTFRSQHDLHVHCGAEFSVSSGKRPDTRELQSPPQRGSGSIRMHSTEVWKT